jgi:nucleoside-diphosphate-sugar epimerase
MTLTPSPSTVLVLGGTGFIGQALIRRLLDAGRPTRALVRQLAGPAAELAASGVETVVGDLNDAASIDAALDGVGHVIHLARGHGSTWGDYLRHDVASTRRLAEQCAARGITLFYASSIAIYRGGRDGDVIDESTAPCPHALRINPYARAKAANEAMLAELRLTLGLKAVVFRPGMVIGVGGSTRVAGVGAWPSGTLCRPWGGGHLRLPFVLVDDCADAFVRALSVDGLDGDSFNLIGDAPMTGNEYLDALERATGVAIRRAPLSSAMLYARSVAKWAVQALRGSPGLERPSYHYFEGLIRRGLYASDHAKRRLGWAPAADAATLIERGIGPGANNDKT